MPIDVSCGSCGQKMRVADTYAGKKAKCPKCQGVIQIPNPVAAPAAGADAWHVQTPDGQQYGPITRAELEQWVAQQRVTHECQLLQDGWEQWKWADEVFPQVAAQQQAAQPQAVVQQAASNPFAAIGGSPAAASNNPFAAAAANPFGGGDSPAANPFAAPQTSGRAAQGGGYEGDAYTRGMVQALVQTRPWVFFLSILGFIGGGLGAIGWLFFFLGAVKSGVGFLIVLALVSGATITVGIFASFYLFKYSQSILTFQHTRGPRQLEEAIVAQKSYWKLVGIVTVVLIVLYFILLILFVMMGVPSGPPRGFGGT